MMMLAKTADQKPFTSNFSLHSDTSIRIAALTMIRNKPKVRITAGSVSILSKDPRVAFSNPNNSATQR
jgi:hypothetical protein